MNVMQAITVAIRRLAQAGIDNPQLDARLLVSHVLGLDRAQLVSASERIVTDSENAAVENLLARREKHESVARIMGSREFWGLRFGLNEATLEPRPDSETLVEAVLKNGKDGARILDLGTGTGCLLLSLLHEWPSATGLGIDAAPHAVERATGNAAALGLEMRAIFRTGNWLDGIDKTFDIIVSNPPYIPSSEITALMPEVRDHDPSLALDGGIDGLGPYRLLIPQVKNFLNSGGLAAFEVGQNQAAQVADLFKINGFTDITAHKDLGHIERCITSVRPAQ
jgi:release factor glutamine methyltransferase